jgi:hypothetical protein
MTHRRIVVLVPVLLAATFVFFHSGARAGSLCERERFVNWGEWSWWPPGARCTYGEPLMHEVLFNPWFLFGAMGVLLFAAIALTLMDSRAPMNSRRDRRHRGL